MDLQLNLSDLNGVGSKLAEKLERLGLFNSTDLLFYYPRDYHDYTEVTKIRDVLSTVNRNNASKFTIKAKIQGIASKRTSRRNFMVTEAVVADETGSLKVVWFNQPYLEKMFKAGTELILNGSVLWNRFSNQPVMESPERASEPKIVPVYGETKGISSYLIAKLVAKVLPILEHLDEYLPESILKEYSLMGVREAITLVHQPKNASVLDQARRRLAFDELFMIALRANLTKKELKKEFAPKIEISDSELAEFVKSLPFELTVDQKKGSWQIIQDLKGQSRNLSSHSVAGLPDNLITPMNRLLNGDVGSGKTVVAAIGAYAAVGAGYRVAIMCPTSILANQHFETFCKLLKKEKVSVGLITRERKEICQFSDINDQLSAKNQVSIENCKLNIDNSEFGICQILIGTHALLQKSVKLDNLGLVIIDEQHRFGVAQRATLLQLGRYNNQDTRDKKEQLNDQLENDNCQKMRPHFLSMTATPIPRTLHLALFGDLDLSVIREKPKNRKEIKTRLVAQENRKKAYQFIRAQVEQGRQVFIICPLIENIIHESQISNQEESISYKQLAISNEQSDERKTVVEEAKKLQVIFPEFKIGMLHGRMPAKARSRPEGGKFESKDEVMGNFLAGELDILVSTSVVEVGVDVPNASVMVIEDAERFGSAQLHQFRGRVGRAEHQSYCLLFTSTMSQKALTRLKSLEVTTDGFRLAEIDLETRGPGAVFGTEQSGLLDLKMATLADRELIEEASQAAKGLIESDPELKKHPLLKNRVSEYMQSKHFE